MGRVLAQPNRMSQIGVGMEFDHEVRRTAFASEACIQPVKKLLAAGYNSLETILYGDGFLRTGAGGMAFPASLASESASFVPSIASSSVSR
jgi:hypothetical protein